MDQMPSGKGKRFIILHAGTGSEGLIDGCDLVFQVKSKDGEKIKQKKTSVVYKTDKKVILVNPCFIQVHDIISCFPKRFDLSQIITPIIDNRHLVVQNCSIITYFFRKRPQ
jgi:hypothetical protein